MLPRDIEKTLLKDKLKNISMLGFFSKRDPVKILKHNKSIMAMGISDQPWWYVAIKKPYDFAWFLDHTGTEDRYLAVIEDDLLEDLRLRFTFRWKLSVYRFFLDKELGDSPCDLNIKNLTTADAEHIFNNSNYKDYLSLDYVKEQINQGPAIGYWENGVLAGWVLTHDDGALGMLHVLDDYRRKGIARKLVLEIIKRVQALGLIPFTYVEPENCPSFNLIKSLNFTTDRIVHWVNINR